jgi:hypothetical protein
VAVELLEQPAPGLCGQVFKFGIKRAMKISMNKGTISFVALIVAVALRLIHKLQESASHAIPVGYEDEAGFHFGDPTVEK